MDDDLGGIVVRLQAAESEIARLRDAESASRKVDRLRHDYETFAKSIEMRMFEYDKERSMASRIAWPVVIALLTAAAIGVFVLLLKVNGIIGS